MRPTTSPRFRQNSQPRFKGKDRRQRRAASQTPKATTKTSPENVTLTLDRLTVDRNPVGKRSAYLRARKVETRYAALLRKVARHIGDLIMAFDGHDLNRLGPLQTALQRYAMALRPWAESVANRMVTEIAARDRKGWRDASEEIGKGVSQLMQEAPVGDTIRTLMADQVDLITSLPRDAAQRVHNLVMEGLSDSTRASEISKRIMETGEVTKSRANLIARTETGRIQTTLTQVRAEHVGSTHFIWRTIGDSDVRPSHKRLNGKVFEWRNPPICDDPDHRALPGCIWNCRCYAEPVIPED